MYQLFLLFFFRQLATFALNQIRRCHFRKSGRRISVKPVAQPSTSHYKNKRKPAWVVERIIYLRALNANASCRHIEHTFNRLYAAKHNITVGRTFVHYTLQQHVYEILELRRQFKRRIPRPMPFNETWAIDMTGKGDRNGDIHSIFGILDHGSRKLLSLEALHNKNAWTLLGHLFLAFGRYGKPRKLRSDNEAVFRSRLFRLFLALAGIRHQFTDPGCPWMNGRIERFFGSLKAKLDRFQVDGCDTLVSMLAEFCFWYNAVRPHQHLYGCTPDEIWLGIDPYARTPKTAQFYSGWEGALQGFYLRY